MPEKTLPPEHWSLVCDAPYTGSADHRGLLQIRHPWVVSREGASAEWRTRASVPGEWAGGGPLFLSFYQSDNYAGARHEDASWLGVQAFRGHRFKQLLVNGQLLWEEDVAEEELGDPGAASSGYHDPYRVVRVPDDLGPEWEIVLRVVDRVASTTALDGDQYYRYSWGTADPEQTRHCFHTDVFFGDVALTTRPEPARPARRPSVRPAPAPPARALPPEGIPLPLQTPGNLPGAGYPVRCGVPLPEGLVPAGSLFALRDPAGRPAPAMVTETSHRRARAVGGVRWQFPAAGPAPAMVTETSHWRDGSVRWVLCEFPAAEAGVWHLLPGADPAPCPDPVRVRTDDGLVVENGRLSLRIGAAAGEGLFEEIVNGAARHLGAGRLSLKMNRVGWLEAFRGIRHEAVVERAGDVCAVIRLSGELLSTEGTRFGPWTARLQVWAGLPYVLIDWGLVNESDQAMAMILDWSAQFALPPGETPLADFGDFHTPTPEQWEADWWYRASPAKYSRENLRALPVTENSLYTCRQDTAELARIQAQLSWIGAARQAPGYVRLTRGGSTLVGAMRWFAEEFPKGIVVQPDALHLATLPEAAGGMAWAHDVPWVHMGRGEGKRQAMALWLSEEPLPPEDAGRFTACLNDPPRLFDSGWFVDAGVMECWSAGVLERQHSSTPTLQHSNTPAERWHSAVGPVLAWSGIGAPRLGHREYWDTAWMNNYRSRAHAGLLRYVETGDPRWLRYFDAACRHLCDVDIIHFCPEHPEWVGCIHQWSVDHTSGPASSNIGLGSDDLLEHSLMTGDLESLEAARGLAERILGCEPWSRSARAVGWPLAQVIRWYDQTGDDRFLAKAEEFVRAARAYTEPRRGVFDEIHGNWSYHGSVPFMTAYLAYGLIRYHQATGKAEALDLLCLLADGILAECRTAPGRVRYSPNPEGNLVGRAASSCAWSVNLGGLFGYAFLHTGDAVYEQGMRECFEAVLEHPEEISLDMVELQGWLLRAIGERNTP